MKAIIPQFMAGAPPGDTHPLPGSHGRHLLEHSSRGWLVAHGCSLACRAIPSARAEGMLARELPLGTTPALPVACCWHCEYHYWGSKKVVAYYPHDDSVLDW